MAKKESAARPPAVATLGKASLHCSQWCRSISEWNESNVTLPRPQRSYGGLSVSPGTGREPRDGHLDLLTAPEFWK